MRRRTSLTLFLSLTWSIPGSSFHSLVPDLILLSLSLSHLSILPERLRSSQIRAPPNKRADRVYSRGSERLSAPRKREEIGIPALYSRPPSSLPFLSSTVLNSERLRAENRRIPRRFRAIVGSTDVAFGENKDDPRSARKLVLPSFPIREAREKEDTERGAKKIICRRFLPRATQR